MRQIENSGHEPNTPSEWVRSQPSEWQGTWRNIDPGIITYDIVSKMKELGLAIRNLESRLAPGMLDHTRNAAHHLLTMCFKDGRSPSAIRDTADDGIVFYFYPVPGTPTIYVCLEIYSDFEVVAAWSDGYSDDALDLGTNPNAQTVSDALKEFHALVSAPERGRT